MTKDSSIRSKIRSKVLNDLAKERISKRTGKKQVLEVERVSDSDDSDYESGKNNVNQTKNKNSLLSILPKPKHGSMFGPTLRLDKMLKMPERAKLEPISMEERPAVFTDEDGLVQVDVSKMVSDPVVAPIGPAVQDDVKVVIPKGKEKQKNQITYLAQLSKATEIQQKEQAAQGRINKAAARAKYGW